MSMTHSTELDFSQSGPSANKGRLVSVLLPLPFAAPYTYRLLEDEGQGSVLPGAYVEVPLGSRKVIGVIWDAEPDEVEEKKLKDVIRVMDAPPMTREMRRFMDFVATYNFRAPGTILGLSMRSRSAFEPPKMKRLVLPTGAVPSPMTPARARVLEAAADDFARTPAQLAEASGTSGSVIKGLIDKGALKTVEVPADAPFDPPDPDHMAVTLGPDQQVAADDLVASVEAGSYEAIVLDGVTGSGKTLVYFEAIAAALKAGRQALVLLPEIALTHQILERFAERFGAEPAAWHSGLKGPQRRRMFNAIQSGEARVVIGARSALFLPFPELGLLIIDEEHDSSFKQEDGVIYHARDMGVARASIGKFPVILASATPSLETNVNAQTGKYRRLTLPTRHGSATLPDIAAIDMRGETLASGKFLSPRLLGALEDNMSGRHQSLLYLNRRGYAPLTLCRSCGHRMMSPDSSTWLVEHRFANRLVCHHTGFSMPKPDACPECGTKGSLAACGPGVERIAEETREHFPNARIEVLSSDAVTGSDEARALFKRMEGGDIDILIGTQIVAKGHNFPGLTLVGIVDADLGLKGGDLRASERTYQLLHQVAGRAGRAGDKGRVLLQTFMPDHQIIAALVSGDRDAFLAREAFERETMAMPPYGRLVAIVISGPREGEVIDVARALARKAPPSEALVLGPTPAVLALLRGRFRHRLLVKAPRAMNVQAWLEAWFDGFKAPSSVRITVDVDPYSFL